MADISRNEEPRQNPRLLICEVDLTPVNLITIDRAYLDMFE